jgi:predicted transcriptional regulator
MLDTLTAEMAKSQQTFVSKAERDMMIAFQYRNGLTAEQLAEEVGLTPQRIYQIITLEKAKKQLWRRNT